MTRYVAEGTVEVALVTTIASAGAPTAAECNAGVDLTGSMLGDLTLPFSGSTTDAADMSSAFNKTAPGDYGGSAGSFTVHREKALADDTVWAALDRDFVGYLVVATRGLATKGTFAVADKVDIWAITILSNEAQYSRGQTVRNAINFAITDDPIFDYAIAS